MEQLEYRWRCGARPTRSQSPGCRRKRESVATSRPEVLRAHIEVGTVRVQHLDPQRGGHGGLIGRLYLDGHGEAFVETTLLQRAGEQRIVCPADDLDGLGILPRPSDGTQKHRTPVSRV